MLDKKDLESIKLALDEADLQREEVIKQSRAIVRKSKEVIYSLHRDDKVDLKEINAMFEALNFFVSDKPKLKYTGSFKVAVQEYVEAVSLYEILKNNRLPTNLELKLEPDHYLLGLIDVTGELVRRAINQSIKGNFQESVKLKEVVSSIYDELMLFDFSNGELRKKFDSIKYDLQKLENLILELTLKDKIWKKKVSGQEFCIQLS